MDERLAFIKSAEPVFREMDSINTVHVRSMWTIADRVLATIPAEPGRGFATINTLRAGGNEGSVAERLDWLADEAEIRGLTTVDGYPYTAESLSNYREMAMSWAPTDRHPEAAFRTHQEAGGRNSRGRVVLDALCRVAQGELVECPTDSTWTDPLDEEAWELAVARVRGKKPKNRLPVSANDLRVALKRRANTAPEMSAGLGTTFTEVMNHLGRARANITAFKVKFIDLEMDREQLGAVLSAFDELIDAATDTRNAVAGSTFSDAELDAFIEGAN